MLGRESQHQLAHGWDFQPLSAHHVQPFLFQYSIDHRELAAPTTNRLIRSLQQTVGNQQHHVGQESQISQIWVKDANEPGRFLMTVDTITGKHFHFPNSG